ncbi:MAG TPA: phosphoribosylformylglycinamidine synthase subunit PurS [Methanofastidiosum sp.]|nr:phosphoribosylformylglycinamidine synthase subunit PurS [Methanofastidiosum sp.]HPC80871.1 phosphoribosylformylglycinamidine synthase subunit PurS [Methanofastidiosum sp.]HRS26246.1 phosphoribosylformylglycinamidine synthase subunit PurS [Methanofastidiosum sp.]
MEIKVGLKEGIPDPEGVNIKKSLKLLGFENVENVEVKKSYVMEISGKDEKKIREDIDMMCKKLLINPVIHDYKVDMIK